ncbi:MAG: acyltransferase [Syntrophomonadaceae bacterium]|nr:acyltransferase [Syntrophomonadaceae bacterium]
MKARLHEYDILRSVAVLSVIAIHVTAGYVYSSKAGFLWNQAMRNAVPLFIIMSGYLLYRGDIKIWLPVKQFLAKRCGRVLIPYVIWTFIYIVLTDIILSQALPGFQSFTAALGKALLNGTGFYHLYFIIIILQLYLLYPLLRNWMKQHPISLLLVAFLITLAAQTVIYFSEMKWLTLPSFGFLYSSLFPVWLFYFIFGMYLVTNNKRVEALSIRHFAGTGIIFVFSLGLVILDSIYTSTAATSIKPSLILYTIVSYFFLYALAMRITKFEKLIIYSRWIADQSFLIFLIHPFVLTGLTEMVWLPGLRNIWNGNIGMLGLYLITVTLSAGISYIISLTPLAKTLGGISKKA